MFKKLKLGTKFVLTLMIISLVPLAVISLSNYYYSKSQIESTTIGSLRAVNDSRAVHINHLIELRQEQAKELAGTFLIRQLASTGVNHPEIIASVQEHIDSVFLELKATPKSDYEFIDRISDIENISVWDIHGNIIANTNRNLIGKKEPFTFLHILYEKGAYFKGYERDQLTGEKVLTILEGIRNWRTGSYAGVVLLKTKARILNDITTARQGLGKTSETYLVDKDHRMITESRFIKDSVLKVRVNTDGTKGCFSKKEVPDIYKNYQGNLVLGAQKLLPDQDWCLITETDVNEAFEPIRVFRNWILAIVGILIVLILVFVHISSKSFIRPILDLRDASLEVGKGQYDIAIDLKSEDEVGELATAFNTMTDSLAKAREQLEVKNKELEEQKILLEKANKELDSFVYTASHDLRAPLRGIASFAEFLKEDHAQKLDEEGNDYIDEIQKGAKRLSILIEDLLTLSRISRIQNPYEDVDTNKLAKEMVERIKYDVQEKKVDLKIQEGMPIVHCDRIKMGEVFLNLINNAIKFSSRNEAVQPKVEVGFIDEPEFFRFFVKDNGIGIDPKFHDQIFGIFKRLVTDKEYTGSGAGLSIVKRIVDDHNGKIWIDSAVGEGATFFFTVPKNLRNKE